MLGMPLGILTVDAIPSDYRQVQGIIEYSIPIDDTICEYLKIGLSAIDVY